MLADPEAIVQVLDASVDACLGSWPKAQADGDDPGALRGIAACKVASHHVYSCGKSRASSGLHWTLH